ncbi:glycerate kinase [Metasolibacillus meyeri]|uniref:Glycerate kinase n=1 Tax=Metasolibacillus meyeri TaxID=1071052 RepID=A0AAW9NK45_9BACL|nr:glycerate kinase [Metasolibacillus meyeri]MEC1177502.1 glycerate kinase [Metasolibacillus meyeri]
MKIVISPDSFKGTLTALQAAESIERGIKQRMPDATTSLLPIADGGEGTLTTLAQQIHTAKVLDPIGREISANYGVLGDGTTCVIEMAQASGLTLLRPEERNPAIASSYGTGQLIRHALNQGYREFIICIGGSATNDGGVGMLRALGLRLLDETGVEVEQTIDGLHHIHRLDFTNWDEKIQHAHFSIACDVDSPLIGEKGATAVFGKQKGVQDIAYFDAALTKWADVVETEKGIRLHNYKGAGAAGGMGGALIAFLNGQFYQGIELVLERLQFAKAIERADLIITGEGQSDAQTLHGKAPFGVLSYAKKQNIPVALLSGSIVKEDRELLAQHFEFCRAVVQHDVTIAMAMREPAKYLTNAAFRLIADIR